MLPNLLDCLRACRGLQHGIAACLQQDPADTPDIRLIVHHQNADRLFHGCSLLFVALLYHTSASFRAELRIFKTFFLPRTKTA